MFNLLHTDSKYSGVRNRWSFYLRIRFALDLLDIGAQVICQKWNVTSRASHDLSKRSGPFSMHCGYAEIHLLCKEHMKRILRSRIFLPHTTYSQGALVCNGVKLMPFCIWIFWAIKLSWKELFSHSAVEICYFKPKANWVLSSHASLCQSYPNFDSFGI